MARIENGVYWCARDLAGLAFVGNHHFILLVAGKDNFGQFNLVPKEEDGVFFYTFGGFRSDDGKLILGANNKHDVISVREHVDPDQHTSLFLPDLDLEPHRVNPPEGSELEFMALVSKLAANYETNTKESAPEYELFDDNCAVWVNTLFAVAKVSVKDRKELADFFGLDVVDVKELLDQTLFLPR